MTPTETQRSKHIARELLEALIIALILAIIIRTFIVQAFKIPSGSMLPTLEIGDQILVNKFIYGIKLPFVGKIIIPIKTPHQNDIVVFRFPKNPDVDYIKRVIAVAGDTVEIRNKIIYINGKPYDDKYGTFIDPFIRPPGDKRDNLGPFTVPEGSLFVMGDNRDNSNDSRFWGYVDLEAVRGKAFIIYWSWNIDYPWYDPDRYLSVRWNRIGQLLH